MPRADNGVYSLPNGTIVSNGDTLLTSQHNPFAQDVAQALTNSLDRNGTGGMNANLPMRGNRVVGAGDAVNPGDCVTLRQLQGSASIPIGAVIDFWGTVAPENYMFAAGQEVSRASFSELFAAIGTVGGSGNGTTTFNLPDYRGAVGAGRDNMGGANKGLLSNFASTVLGSIFGNQSHTLTQGQMPNHNHTVNDPGHTHTYRAPGDGVRPSGTGANTAEVISAGNLQTGSKVTGITLSSAGSGQAHNNTQPTIICNKIIRVR